MVCQEHGAEASPQEIQFWGNSDMTRMDTLALFAGVALMGLTVLRPWEPADPSATFALGMGLSAIPMLKCFAELIYAVRR